MLERFSREHKITICNYYAENESGARLDRPKLFRLLKDCQRGDVLLVEDVRMKGCCSPDTAQDRRATCQLLLSKTASGWSGKGMLKCKSRSQLDAEHRQMLSL